MCHRLSTSFAFLPRTVADPPSPLRALVYAEGGAILGPDADPYGWKVFDPVKFTGMLFNARDVSVQCTVSGLSVGHRHTLSQEGAQLAVATPVCDLFAPLLASPVKF